MRSLKWKMNLWISYLLVAFLGVEVSMSIQRLPPPTCGQFPASFLAIVDQTIDSPDAFIVADPELTFLKEVVGLRDDAIQHTLEDAMKFFNETYGLDFSLSPPTDQNEYFYQNAVMSPFRLAEEVDNLVTLNNWIQTGNTRSTCFKIRDGGFRATVSDVQILHGSYGGAGGIPIGVTEFVWYGFANINVCAQSPLNIQFQSASPVRQIPFDGAGFQNCDVYSPVLGRGKAQGFFTLTIDPNDPDKFRFVANTAFVFPAN